MYQNKAAPQIFLQGMPVLEHTILEDGQCILMKDTRQVFMGSLIYLYTVWYATQAIDDYIEW